MAQDARDIEENIKLYRKLERTKKQLLEIVDTAGKSPTEYTKKELEGFLKDAKEQLRDLELVFDKLRASGVEKELKKRE